MRSTAPLLLLLVGCTASSPAVAPPPSEPPPASSSRPPATPSATASASATPAVTHQPITPAQHEEARKTIAESLKIPVAQVRLTEGVIFLGKRRSYTAAWSESAPEKRWLVAIHLCSSSAVCVAPPIAMPHAQFNLFGYIDLEGEPREDLAAAGVSIRLDQGPERMKHPALWVRSSKEGRESKLLLVDVSGDRFSKVLEATLFAQDAGGSEAIRQIALEQGTGPVLNVTLLGEALPPPGQPGHPGPPRLFRYRWVDKESTYALD